MNMEQYYKQLVGAQIIGFEFEEDESALEPFPVFKLMLGNPELGITPMFLKLSLSMDEEGNGGGFAFIEELKQ